MGYAHRSDEDRAKALAAYEANGRNLTKTARETGVAATTLKRWVLNGGGAPPAHLVEQNKASLADLWEGVTRTALDLIAKAQVTLEETGGTLIVDHLADMNRVAGTGTDKALALRGQPTEYHRHEIILDIGAKEL